METTESIEKAVSSFKRYLIGYQYNEKFHKSFDLGIGLKAGYADIFTKEVNISKMDNSVYTSIHHGFLYDDSLSDYVEKEMIPLAIRIYLCVQYNINSRLQAISEFGLGGGTLIHAGLNYKLF